MKSLSNTTLTVGLMSVPVKVFSAVEDNEIRFNYCAPDGSPVEQVYRTVDDEEIVGTADDCEKSYEGVLIGRDSIDAINAEAVRDDNGDDLKAFNIRHFVPLSVISPLRAQRQYYIGFDPAAKGNVQAFAALVKAMERRKVAGICKWVVRNKQHIVAVFPYEGRLRAVTLAFAENVRQPNADTDRHMDVKVDRKLARMMAQVIDAYRTPDGAVIDQLTDSVHAKRMKLVEDVMAGERVTVPVAIQPKESPDLMAALEATMAQAREAKAAA